MIRSRLSCPILVLLLAALTAGCHQPPHGQWNELLQARERLRQSRAETYFPVESVSFGSAFEALRLDYDRASNRLFHWREDEELALRIRRQRDAAESLIQQSAGLEASLRESQDVAWRLADRILQSLQPTLDPRIRRQRRDAEIRLRVARDLWERGEYLAARQPLAEAERRVAELESRWRQILARFADPDLQKAWEAWAAETIRWSRREGKAAVVVDKYNRRAKLYDSGRLAREFPIEMGWNPLLDKRREGDGATPEGRYRVVALKAKGQTRFHLALLLDYPNGEDRRRFRAAVGRGEMAASTPLGGLIELHGDGGRGRDWTLGCVALDNDSMGQLFRHAYEGMPVAIVGRLQP